MKCYQGLEIFREYLRQPGLDLINSDGKKQASVWNVNNFHGLQ